MNLRFAGFGGQGVVMCGYIFGKAAVLDGKNAIHTQSYGSASRGGLTRSDVGIEEGEIYELCVEELDVLVAMSQQSYDAFSSQIKEDGQLFYESHLVTPGPDHGNRALGIAATDLAYKTFGRKIIANMVMMGFVNAIAGIVSQESLQRTVIESVPAGTEEININALEEGARIARELSAER
jgi:2-oxoglutarate ferredoxin oxidoreductase subunit gamma